jgi:hypothetical protein
MLLLCCSAQNPIEMDKAKLTSSNCPTEGECNVELVKNKSLNIKRDDFGSLYYQLLESTDKSVIVYRLSKDRDETLQDSGYSENILIEVNNDNSDVSLSGKELAGANILFGRHSFSRTGNGNFKVSDGNLVIKRQSGKLLISFQFSVPEVPHIIKNIEIEVQ